MTEIGAGRVTLSDGTQISTRCVVWGGGIKAPTIASAAGLPQGRGGRIDVLEDLSVDGFPGVYAVGDVANIPAPDGGTHPAARLGRPAERRLGGATTSSPTAAASPARASTTTTRESWP